MQYKVRKYDEDVQTAEEPLAATVPARVAIIHIHSTNNSNKPAVFNVGVAVQLGLHNPFRHIIEVPCEPFFRPFDKPAKVNRSGLELISEIVML